MIKFCDGDWKQLFTILQKFFDQAILTVIRIRFLELYQQQQHITSISEIIKRTLQIFISFKSFKAILLC